MTNAFTDLSDFLKSGITPQQMAMKSHPFTNETMQQFYKRSHATTAISTFEQRYQMVKNRRQARNGLLLKRRNLLEIAKDKEERERAQKERWERLQKWKKEKNVVREADKNVKKKPFYTR